MSAAVQSVSTCHSFPQHLRSLSFAYQHEGSPEMHTFPHRYVVTAAGESTGSMQIGSQGLPALQATAPPEFGGPSGFWSPETLLVAAMAGCFLLTFRSLARAARLTWIRLECRVAGVLDRVEGRSRFTRFEIAATLEICCQADLERARRLLEKAEGDCLVGNSLSGQRSLTADVIVISTDTGTPNVKATETA